MVDAYRACRQFERFLLPYGYDPNEPPDDGKTYEDMLRYPRPVPELPSEDGRLVTIITYYPKSRKVTYTRVI